MSIFTTRRATFFNVISSLNLILSFGFFFSAPLRADEPDALPALVQEVTEARVETESVVEESDFSPGTALAPQGIVEADLAVAPMMKLIEVGARGIRKSISDLVLVVIHEGPVVPAEMRWILEHFKRAGIQIKILRKRLPQGITLKYRHITEERAAGQLLLKFEYEAQNNPELKKLIDRGTLDATFARTTIREITTRLRAFFGLHNGISWAMYSDTKNGYRRPLKEKLTEICGGAFVAAIVAGVTYVTLFQKAMTDPSLHVVRGVLTAAYFHLFWSFFDRANNVFHAQGKKWFDDGRKSFDTNRPWFYFSNFKDSLMTNVIIQMAVHGVAGMTPELVIHSAWNTTISLFAKILPKLWIAKHQDPGHGHLKDTQSRSHSPYKTIFLNFCFSLGMQTLKIGHLFNWSEAASAIFIGLGVAGVGYEAYQHVYGGKKPENLPDAWSMLRHRMKKNWNRFSIAVGWKKPENCSTEFYLRALTSREVELLDSRSRAALSPEERRELAALGIL